MPTKDIWQFRSVQDLGQHTRNSYDLGVNCPITLISRPYTGNETLPDGFDNTIAPKLGDVVVEFGLPADLGNFALSGVARVICSTTGFPRDGDDFDATRATFTDQAFTLDLNVRDDVKYRCLVPSLEGTIVYISVFYYSAQSAVWLTSPNHLMDRIVTRGQSGFWGEKMFDLLPRFTRRLDADHDDAVKNLLHIFGTSLDDLSSVLKSVDSFDPFTIDAGKIPFLDRLVGWPTNYELREDLRRVETTQAVSLWKTKSSARALDLVMQNTIGWSVDVHEGMDQVFRLNTELLTQPNDWIEGEAAPDSDLPADQQNCGVWNDVQTPYMATWSPSGATVRSPENQNMILPSNNGWQNLNGVLIRIRPSEVARTKLSLLAIKKAKNLVPLFIPHYAQVFFVVTEYYQEALRFGLSTEFDDDFGTIYPTEPLMLDIAENTGKYKSALCLFHTWDENTELNSTQYRTFHNAIEFTCG